MGEKTRVNLVPPDGGWGYVTCCATIVMLIPIVGFRQSFGMMYHDLMEDIGMDSVTMGLATGLTVMIGAISAFFSSSVLRVLSLRQAALLAATLVNVGSIALVFSNSIPTFLLTQTFIQDHLVAFCPFILTERAIFLKKFIMIFLLSSGFGLMFNVAYTSIRGYFLKKRLLAISIVQTTIAVTVMCTPIIIKYTTDFYGHRGMLIIIAALSLHQFVGVSLLQPVAWHMKKVEAPGKISVEMKSLLQSSNNSNANDVPVNQQNVAENAKINNLQDNTKMNSVEIENISAVNKFFNHIIDVELFKRFIISIPNLALGIATFTGFIYIVMLPRALYAKGESHSEVARTLSLVGFGDLGMKIAFIFLSTFLKRIESRKLHLVGSTIAFTARTAFQLTNHYIAKYVFLTCVGVGQCFITVLMPLVVADSVEPTKYSGAMGINGLTVGLLNLILGPIYGAIKDVTDSYDVVFWICNATFFGIAVLWIIEIKTKKTDLSLESNKA